MHCQTNIKVKCVNVAQHNLNAWYCLFIQLLEKWDIYWGEGGGVQSICPLNNFNFLYCIIIKLCENVCWQNISAKLDNQPDPMKHFRVMALELAKFAKMNLVRSVTWILFNGSSLNFVILFVGIISWPSLITSQIPWSTLELWPLNYPRLENHSYGWHQCGLAETDTTPSCTSKDRVPKCRSSAVHVP